MSRVPSPPASIPPDRTDGKAMYQTAVRRDDTVCTRAMTKVQLSRSSEMR